MAAQNALHRKDSLVGPPLRILSIDGGGVRGYSVLIIIQELMYRTYVEIHGKAPKRNQIPKPADHFDLIIGSGTGGLIAIMLGRLRLDLETCKEMYIRTSRKVFESDKRIAGIPYTSTLFKASKLEEAIKQCVMEHTILKSEGNDGAEPPAVDNFLTNSMNNLIRGRRYHSRNSSMVSLSTRVSRSSSNPPFSVADLGNPDALLYDKRENRTKTAVTAVYKGTPRGGQPALLRSYDSRKEPPPEFDCKIWEAGRASSAMVLAFKEIQIRQSVFLDEGSGKFNPSPIALEEACVNEWPCREVGVFLSIGTGKRPRGSDMNAYLWYEGFLGEYADAKRRMISKIEGCEKIHEYMLQECLAKYGVNPENYYRFNVEVGVGEFEMNEWTRLADISTSTRRYLGKPDVQRQSLRAASRLAAIHKAKIRNESVLNNIISKKQSILSDTIPDIIPEPHLNAVELPAKAPAYIPYRDPQRNSWHNSSESKDHDNLDIIVTPRTSSTRSSIGSRSSIRSPISKSEVDDISGAGTGRISIINTDESLTSRPLSVHRVDPPPLPPKVTIWQPDETEKLIPPYPLDDEPPPAVNKSLKPDYKVS
ncbi:hypothetical protein HI914_03364 [Erysiphe necator]|uniref:Putative lysophospholipase-like protein n=1 Tax=Uncinula necator TaxID=52586 RepID=A0A0B1P2B3_UNCNE|nr:hypothetical protein HI914_03364 [Erysiphe necator]KHJ31485.1 putative lysophospholipase-like protein [Erysiphe necator]